VTEQPGVPPVTESTEQVIEPENQKQVILINEDVPPKEQVHHESVIVTDDVPDKENTGSERMEEQQVITTSTEDIPTSLDYDDTHSHTHIEPDKQREVEDLAPKTLIQRDDIPSTEMTEVSQTSPPEEKVDEVPQEFVPQVFVPQECVPQEQETIVPDEEVKNDISESPEEEPPVEEEEGAEPVQEPIEV
jgi:hypothetical protein